MKALRLRREFGLYQPRHEIDAENGTNDAERICNRVPDRWVLALYDIERGLKRRGAGHRSSIQAQRMTDLDTKNLSEAECDEQARDAGDQRQQIVLLPDAHHAFKELTAIENADAVKEHDQPREADRACDLGLRRKCTDRQT